MASDVRNKKSSPFGQLLEAVSAEYSSKIGKWDENLQRDLPKKWEKHGDMVLLPENSFTLKEWRMLGKFSLRDCRFRDEVIFNACKFLFIKLLHSKKCFACCRIV
jgi:hypothetical protein